jgi:hypothetical protein
MARVDLDAHLDDFASRHHAVMLQQVGAPHARRLRKRSRAQ